MLLFLVTLHGLLQTKKRVSSKWQAFKDGFIKQIPSIFLHLSNARLWVYFFFLSNMVFLPKKINIWTKAFTRIGRKLKFSALYLLSRARSFWTDPLPTSKKNPLKSNPSLVPWDNCLVKIVCLLGPGTNQCWCNHVRNSARWEQPWFITWVGGRQILEKWNGQVPCGWTVLERVLRIHQGFECLSAVLINLLNYPTQTAGCVTVAPKHTQPQRSRRRVQWAKAYRLPKKNF